MLNSTEIKFLTKNRKIDEQKQYRNLISTRSQYATSLGENKKKLASVLSRIDEISNNNLNLEAERAKLQKTYNDIMLQRQLIKEAKQKELVPQVLPVAPSPSPVIDSPATIVNPPVAPVEAKKSNLGMILGVAALGVGAYLYTKE
jgi:hypothetical protein